LHRKKLTTRPEHFTQSCFPALLNNNPALRAGAIYTTTQLKCFSRMRGCNFKLRACRLNLKRHMSLVTSNCHSCQWSFCADAGVIPVPGPRYQVRVCLVKACCFVCGLIRRNPRSAGVKTGSPRAPDGCSCSSTSFALPLRATVKCRHEGTRWLLFTPLSRRHVRSTNCDLSRLPRSLKWIKTQ
jgi:hypothetical protein